MISDINSTGRNGKKSIYAWNEETFGLARMVTFFRVTEGMQPASTPQVAPHVTPHVTDHVTIHVTTHVKKIMSALKGKMIRDEILAAVGLKDRMHFAEEYLKPAIKSGLIGMTISDKRRSIH